VEQSSWHKNTRVSVFTSQLPHYTNTYKLLDRGIRLGGRKAYHVIHTGSPAFLTTNRCMHWFCGLILMPAPECHCAESTHATITTLNTIIAKNHTPVTRHIHNDQFNYFFAYHKRKDNKLPNRSKNHRSYTQWCTHFWRFTLKSTLLKTLLSMRKSQSSRRPRSQLLQPAIHFT